MRFHGSSKLRGTFAALLLCLLTAFPASASSESTVTPQDASAAPAQNLPVMVAPGSLAITKSASDSEEYRVGPQDLLEISVFQVTELNRTVRVNTNGDISLPLIGVVHAGGRTVHDVEDDITEKLKRSFLQNPQVSVFVKEFTSQRVTLEGSVMKPGIYPITGQTSLLQAMAMAGGLSELADPKGVVIFRVIDGKKKAAVFDLTQIRQGTAEDPLIYGDDIVVVDQSGSKSWWSKFMKAVPVFGVFTLF